MATVHLTDREITALKPNAKKPYLIFDDEVSGLAIRVYPSGVKSFVFDWRERGRQRRTTLGQHPVWTVGKARKHTATLRLKADTGEVITPGRGSRVVDLIGKKQEATEEAGQAVDNSLWRNVVKLTRRPSTAKSYLRLIDSHILPAFGKFEPRAITRNAIETWHGEIAKRTPIEANRALATLSAFLSWLEHDRKVDRNLAKGVNRRPENERHFFLTTDEIKAAHAALNKDSNRSAALALRLALLTGARIGEVLTVLTKTSVNVERRIWIKPAATTKQKKLHVAPLQREAIPLAQELMHIGFPDYDACRRAWDRTKKIIGRPDIRIHDLRHSRASSLAAAKASLVQIGAVLGHASPATTARYAHLVDSDLVDLVERS